MLFQIFRLLFQPLINPLIGRKQMGWNEGSRVLFFLDTGDLRLYLFRRVLSTPAVDRDQAVCQELAEGPTRTTRVWLSFSSRNRPGTSARRYCGSSTCARRVRCAYSADGPRLTGYFFRVNQQVRSSSSNRILVRAPSGDRVNRSEKRVLWCFRSREGGGAPFPPRYRYHWPLPLSRRSSCGPSPDGNSANVK